MSCNALEPFIALYIEGDLNLPDRRKVETHLQGCMACSNVAEDLRHSQSMFKSLRTGTVTPSDLAGVRVRVLNEVGDLEPAPGWVVMMHRLFFAGLRRRNAIAGVLLAMLVSGSVWYAQRQIVRVAKSDVPVEATVEVARLDVPDVLVSPVLITPPPVASGVNPAPLPDLLSEAPPENPAEPAFLEPTTPEVQVSQAPPMKFVTEDPNIIIYWLPADKGD